MKKLIILASFLVGSCFAQGTTNDLFVTVGSGLSVGYGHHLSSLAPNPFMDELKGQVTFESYGGDIGGGGFSATTLDFGTRKNIPFRRTPFSFYYGAGVGLTTFSFRDGRVAEPEFNINGGVVFHINPKNGITLQESIYKIKEIPMYGATSIGWIFSW